MKFKKILTFILLPLTLFAEPIPVSNILDHTHITYIKCRDPMQLEFSIFPLASADAFSCAEPLIPETFILSIPQGKVFSREGIAVVNDCLVRELLWQWSPLQTNPVHTHQLPPIQHVSGKVAVLAQEGQQNYYHWMVEVLPKLAMLREKEISYDYLYIPTTHAFMRQTLSLLDIDFGRIIEPHEDVFIEADELIVPSAPSLSCYTPQWIIDFLRNTFLPSAKQLSLEKDFAKRVFISRQKAYQRKILNEDEVFALLEPLGFMRYHLEDLGVLEQVLLFHSAEVIIAPHGAGLANLVFAQPNTQVIEIFQEREDDTFWYLSQSLGIDHHCVKTAEFRKDGGYTDTIVPLSTVIKALKEVGLYQ